MRVRLGKSSGNHPPAPRKLHRQAHSLPDCKNSSASPPLRRCISAGGDEVSKGGGPTTKSLPSAPNANKADPTTASALAKGIAEVASKSTSASASALTCPAGQQPTVPPPTLLDALQNVAMAASTTANALSSTRQEHEEVLQRQREQFQLLMESMRLRSLQQWAPAAATPAAGTPSRAALPSATPTTAATTPTLPRLTPASLTSALRHLSAAGADMPTRTVSTTQTYRGVQFTMPLGCRIESGEEDASKVLVLGPQVHVALQFREEGRNVVLVSSNCVCTIKRVDGRTVVTVVAPLVYQAPSDS